jgi:hypothetical protein
MDRVRLVIGYEWRAYWRRFSRAGLRSNQGIVLLFSALAAFKYFQMLRAAAAGVANGNSRLLVQLLTVVLLVWLFPVAANRRETLASRKWLHLPLSLTERFILRALSLLIPPSAWLVVAGSLAILYPLAYAVYPAAGVLAGLLFVVLAWLLGLTISHLLSSASWRIVLWIAAVAALGLVTVYLTNGGDPGRFSSYRLSPAMLVADAALANWQSSLAKLTILTTLTGLAGVAALWSFKKNLQNPSEGGGRSTSTTLPVLRVVHRRLGGLVAKDFRYFRRLLDTYLGFASALLACLYVVVAEEPSAGIYWSFIVVVFLCNAAVVFNSFGLDSRQGLDRYALLPLNGRAILLSKNLAYLVLMGVQLLPMTVLAGWRLGIVNSAYGVLEAITLAWAYLAWGNWMSVHHPLKMQFFRFANSSAALVDAMGGIVFGSLPGIPMVYLLVSRGPGMAAGILLTLLLTGAIYVASLVRYGSQLERNREQISAALS